MFYNKLMQQLQARDHRGKQRQRGRSSIKVHGFKLHFSDRIGTEMYFLFQNELIIQIMTEAHEIDTLKRKIEDAKMKLITEIKVTLCFTWCIMKLYHLFLFTTLLCS